MPRKPPVILIIKTGSTYNELRATQGNFDKWIRIAGGETGFDWKVKPVAEVEPSKIPSYQGIIISGSHSSLTQMYAFFSGMERVVEQIVAHRIHTLGICFGHQLIHKIMGGQVITNPLGTEMGVVNIQLTMDGLIDPIFKSQGGSKVPVYASHSDIVSKPADSFVQLAWNELSQYQATRYNNFIYTTQFHPEYNKQIMAFYLKKNADMLTKQYWHNPLHLSTAEELLKCNKSLSKSRLIVQNFLHLINGTDS